MPSIAVKGTAVKPTATRPIPVAPPAPRIVAARTVPIVAVRPAVTARPAGLPATRSPFRVLTWRITSRSKAEGLHGLGQDIGPTDAQLAIMLEAGNVFLDMAIDAFRPFLAIGLGTAIHAYERGGTPAAIWGAASARFLAHKALVCGGLLHLRQRLADGSWSWLIEGDTLTAWQTDQLGRASTGMGWVSNSYVTGNPDPRIAPTWLDRLGFSGGAMSLAGVIAGPEAAIGGAVEAGIATTAQASDEAANAIAQAIRAAGAASTPEGAANAARATSAGVKAALEFGQKTNVIKWTAAAIVGTVAALKVPDAINSFRGGQTRATEAGAEAAGALIQHGINTNNPDEVAAGLDAMKVFQKEAGEGEKYLWAAGGFVASEFLRRR